MRKLLATTALLLALAVPAHADIVLGGQPWSFNGIDNLTLTPVVPGGNQPLNVPCVICGDNQPQQDPAFGYTNFKNSGNLATEAFFSTNVSGGGNPGFDTLGTPYDGAFLRAFLLASGDPTLTFSIGIDVNDTNSPQTLSAFYLLNFTTRTVLAAFDGPVPVPSQNNGTGFPDYTLSGFNITVGQDIHAGDQLIFFARITNANDGPDSFFLIPNVVAVPGPIVGAGLPGLVAGCIGLWAFAKRRRNRLSGGLPV
jgi:hypothetical protein